jgi:hypothetical protein
MRQLLKSGDISRSEQFAADITIISNSCNAISLGEKELKAVAVELLLAIWN